MGDVACPCKTSRLDFTPTSSSLQLVAGLPLAALMCLALISAFNIKAGRKPFLSRAPVWVAAGAAVILFVLYLAAGLAVNGTLWAPGLGISGYFQAAVDGLSYIFFISFVVSSLVAAAGLVLLWLVQKVTKNKI